MVSNFYCKEYIFYSTYPSDGRFLGFRSQNISKLFAAFAFAQEIEYSTRCGQALSPVAGY